MSQDRRPGEVTKWLESTRCTVFFLFSAKSASFAPHALLITRNWHRRSRPSARIVADLRRKSRDPGAFALLLKALQSG
jgi:hypothetical protein